MMTSVRGLRGAVIAAVDGTVGVTEQVFFDDDRWTVRYLVVRIGGSFSSRRVLVSSWAVARAVSGYRALGNDGPIERISDFLFDGQTWKIMYLEGIPGRTSLSKEGARSEPVGRRRKLGAPRG
ncbi:MAG TPA: hypothetical protein VMV03_15190 [Spirochaetia bacterium]|nr:hypothetical protein [Spirochaetia bacterium]